MMMKVLKDKRNRKVVYLTVNRWNVKDSIRRDSDTIRKIIGEDLYCAIAGVV